MFFISCLYSPVVVLHDNHMEMILKHYSTLFYDYITSMNILQAYNLLALDTRSSTKLPLPLRFFFQNFVCSIKLIINHVCFIA